MPKTHNCLFIHTQVILYIAFIAKFGCPDSSKFLGTDSKVDDYDIQTTQQTVTSETVLDDGSVETSVHTYNTHELRRVRY